MALPKAERMAPRSAIERRRYGRDELLLIRRAFRQTDTNPNFATDEQELVSTVLPTKGARIIRLVCRRLYTLHG
jgi:hypothetical protein